MTAATTVPHPLATLVVDADDEISPDPYVELSPSGSRTQKIVVSIVVFGPFAGLIAAIVSLWGTSLKPVDVITGLIFYVTSGLGVTIGFHRLLTHRSFVAKRWLRIGLAIAGSFAVQGSATSWVALHRRHHVYSDRPGDPHSPNLTGTGHIERLMGFIHAHTGWLYTAEAADAERWAPDLVADGDIRRVSAYAPLWTVLSFALPALIGLVASGSFAGGFECFLWAGLVRIFVLHHITWSTNSLCHMFGKRPFSTKDLSRNFAPFALLSFGESWHNGHHAFPSSARHGLDKNQFDISARIIKIFEGLGLVSHVRWPNRERLEARRNMDQITRRYAKASLK
ncbi:MAG TPA: acyl-CoA desaturase [Acidimicrobiales bacterium]|nr:acyl-CoA desaturase [Acidimicrobiales bacterium]